jgi:hypothetical protein
MLDVQPTTIHGGHRMRTSIRHFSSAVERLLTLSAVDLPRRTRQRLRFLLLGILLSGTLVLRRIATTHAYLTPQTTSAASHERRLRRVLHDPLLTWDRSDARVVRRILARQRARRWVVIIDETAQAEHLRVLTAALWYRGRAIPLAWIGWPGQTPQTVDYWARCTTLLAQVAQVLPADAPVVVVADAAFGCPAFTDLVTTHGWDWTVRVQGQTRWKDRQGRIGPISAQVRQRGDRWKGRGEVFKKQDWRTASIGAVWGRQHKRPLLLVSSLSLHWDLLALYRKRAAIEALFRDWKTMGWQWESSQVRDLTHQEHLVLGLALATLITLVLGTQAAEAERARPARTQRRQPWHGRQSLFTLGREAFWQRLWQNDRTPIRWELSDLDGTNWSAEQRRQHAPAGTTIGRRAA